MREIVNSFLSVQIFCIIGLGAQSYTCALAHRLSLCGDLSKVSALLMGKQKCRVWLPRLHNPRQPPTPLARKVPGLTYFFNVQHRTTTPPAKEKK